MLKRTLVLMIIVMTVASSCMACIGLTRRFGSKAPIDVTKANESVFKITVAQTVDTSQLAELGLMPDSAYVENTAGTAFAIAADSDTTILLTAGHLCHTEEIYPPEEAGGFILPILEVTQQLISTNGDKFPATIVFDDDESDVCLISAVGRIARPLRVATKEPKVGSHVFYLGAPGGFWVEGVSQLFEGIYGGSTRADGLFFVSAWAEGGASGAPVFTADGVIGVAIANGHAHDGGGETTVAVGLKKVRELYVMAEKALRGTQDGG